MKITVEKSVINGEITAPASKSEIHRALICAALSGGKSVLKNITYNTDVDRTIAALVKLGVNIIRNKNQITVSGDFFKTAGKRITVNCGDSGTTARFITALSALKKGNIIITGSRRLRLRPMKDLILALEYLGVKISHLNGELKLPIKVKGGDISGGMLKVDGTSSSQFVSSLLMIAPFAQKDLEIKVLNMHSAPYIDLTIAMMRKFGIGVRKFKNTYSVKSGLKYKSAVVPISGDYSSASYFLAAAALTKGRVKINNLSRSSFQGDKQFLLILKKMGCIVKTGTNSVILENNQKLKGVSLDMGNFPDLVLALSILAGNCKSALTLKNIGHLKGKESDRIHSISVNLTRMGIKVKKTDDGLIIFPGQFKPAKISSFNDHRIAMSFAVAALSANGRTEISNFQAINKSYPGFLEDFKKIKANIKKL